MKKKEENKFQDFNTVNHKKENKKNCCSRRCTDFKNYEDKKIVPIKQC